MLKCAILFSGAGTTLKAILDYCDQNTTDISIPILITDNPQAGGLQLLTSYNRETLILPWKKGKSESWGKRLVSYLDFFNIDLVVLAGFMRILDNNLCASLKGRVVNIHPSLLPKYKGLNTHQRALEAGDKEHGFSIHMVIPEVDGGTILAQGRVMVHEKDNPATLQERVQQQERFWYPRVLQYIASGRMHLDQHHPAFDNKPVSEKGLALWEL